MFVLCLRVGIKLDIKVLQDSQEVEVHVTFRLPRSGAGNQALSFEQIEAALAQQLNDGVFEQQAAEVDRQAKRKTGELQIGKELCLWSG